MTESKSKTLDFNYRRRATWPVKVGNVTIGGDNPVRLQSMTSTSTMDTDGSVAQIKRIADAGAEIVRLTAQGVREAENLAEISARLRADGCSVPLVADIHFNPRAAFAAASRVEKVRINPGNFVDPGRVFKKIDYTDEEYSAEIEKIEEGLVPLLDICREHSTALRIGVNHGSLSDRIMSRYGDTPAGMVESALEFLRVCLRHDFRDVVISIKASNVCVMVETVRRLVDAMAREDMHFPLHLGVTEAGDAEDGRIKSAVGIGSLLAEGIGDTIRVSLSEEPECEIEPATGIVKFIASLSSGPEVAAVTVGEDYDSYKPSRRKSRWTDRLPQVVGLDIDPDSLSGALALKAEDGIAPELIEELKADSDRVVVLGSEVSNALGHLRAFLTVLKSEGVENPVIVCRDYTGLSEQERTIAASVEFGSLLLAGFADGVWIKASGESRERLTALALNILQATRLRISKTEFISCPGCGRTLYDLQSTLREIKAATSHLKGLKIGVMGCIVNGPGEMADADYGYVGAAAGKISLYKGKECIEKNIPAEEAISHLVSLIKANGDWVEPSGPVR
ncbi:MULTISPECIES: (E)-4-hydroxy-3-methylbut-2-enyl-diphosphate synthase [Duncaniella]|uniref:4-hydroxy-3-methylbut-2-en-1-yl diphosphate synthase (flavodoxin) n=2 Tax=Duncaniella muris TaxID=2094150 RepID=A0A2V1ING2_9BACT|nr:MULTISPECIES: (E)-4-hydroxy-3-methylbut-2-enyl-diphosphate synthase [Duncaniella]NBH92670.1 4-hydroxy-3-methylbut-2-en-1-yl diphosphate synthase [Muribaculaceae bacterium S4]NBI21127.1 4-hydroxy-3-methylbut-2-en-1-yl diphosphate synthase [Muribaculaceae bacterium Z1]PWB01183.1 4-hydroxy-3-methylbut-2-en-1-yl diphosphate synthase [Duncaniella muris]QCD40332.1 (E)-4-hydroxy-3-methylbut-2-enyl-diphosphate synthase [Duncaniella sp. C9]QCP71434.1 (E)-4-hydroxy-3-methylbut-2-enyl-diphosphate synt